MTGLQVYGHVSCGAQEIGVTRVTRLRGRRLIPLGLAVGLVLASVVPAGGYGTTHLTGRVG